MITRALARLGVLALTLLAGAVGATAQAPTPSGLQLALLPQWVIQQHRSVGGLLSPSLGEALDGGVVDRTVFAWQRGVIQRSALVTKPVRVLPDDEAGPLGGRGTFTLGGVRPPAGTGAWTEIEVTRGSTGSDDVLLLELGGERNTVAQVLETLLVARPGARLEEVPLAPTALMAGAGVPIVTAPFGRPLAAGLAARFHDVAGIGILVVRSTVAVTRNGGLSPSGLADTAPLGAGDWREGDRVLLRVPAGQLGRPLPRLVLAWKDRMLQSDPDAEFPRRSSLPLPLIR